METEEISNCKECDYFEVFESKIREGAIINYCHSKRHLIHMIKSITACPEWGIHHGNFMEKEEIENMERIWFNKKYPLKEFKGLSLSEKIRMDSDLEKRRLNMEEFE